MDTLEPATFGAVGDGATDDTGALQAMFDAGPGNLVVFPAPSQRYRVSAVIVRSHTRVIGPASLIADNSVDGNSSVVTVEPDVRLESLDLNVPSGSRLQRCVTITDRCEIGSVVVRADQQLVNADDNLDGAVQIRGDGITVDRVSVSKCDYAVVAYRCRNLRLGHVEIDYYVRGLLLRLVDGCLLDGMHAKGLSPNSRHDPGHNGLLMGSVRRATLRGVHVEDAGEHGVRIGGPDVVDSKAIESEDIVIDSPVVHRSGQCGLKVHPGHGHTVERLTVIAPMLVDSASRSRPGTNEDGLRLQEVHHSRIVAPTITRSQHEISGYDGIYIENCFDVSIDQPRIAGVVRHGIHVERVNGNVNSLFVDGANIRSCGQNGVMIDGTGDHILRDIRLTGLFIRECGGHGVVCRTRSRTSGANQPVVLQGWVSQANQGAKLISQDPDIIDQLDELR